MFHSWTINNKINRLPERAFRIQIFLWGSSYSFSVHERNFRYRNLSFFNGCAPSFLNNVSHENNSNSYDLRNHKELYSTNLRIVRYGTGTVSYVAPKTWSKVPETIKMTSFFKSFKWKIRKWKPECDCRLCTKNLHPKFR